MITREELNEQQYEAATTVDGPILVIAGAGSGKTRTLIYRLAHLISVGVEPENILLLTFTRKASQEMLWRAGQLLHDSCDGVAGGTFHSVANMMLRRYCSYLGYSSSFSIIDRADAEGIVNLLKSSLGLSGKEKQFPSKRVLVNMLSGAVNKSIVLEDLIYEQYAHLSDHVDDILLLDKHYREFKLNNGLMDYDDLLVNWKRLLEEIPEARAAIAGRYRYIMVDEYQDTNFLQAEIVRLLASEHTNVMVVGDDSQSIYSFRGADFYNIMRFPKIFPGTKIVKLEENYRSTQPILELTNDIIRNASEKYTKRLFSSIEGDLVPTVYGGFDERSEAKFVARRIKELADQGEALQDIAVLFRSGFHSYKLEVELANLGLDFEKRGGLKLTESSHMKDGMAFFRVAANPADTLSWNRILLQIDKLGPKTAQKITEYIAAGDNPCDALAQYPAKGAIRAGLSGLLQLLTQMQGEHTPAELFEIVMQYYEPIFKEIYRDDYPKRQKDLEQLKGIMAGYSDLQSFIDDTTLDPPDNSAMERGAADRLVLSTIHSAKGLEWGTVFVIGMAEGRFPHGAAIGNQKEEERRLFYVAATRAKRRLYLCYPKEMMSADRKFTRVGMSSFLRELNTSVYKVLDEGGERPSFLQSYDTDIVSIPKRKSSGAVKRHKLSDFSVGSLVRHPFFGEGTVKKLSQPKSLDIQFNRHGLKTLHLDYAKLTILDE